MLSRTARRKIVAAANSCSGPRLKKSKRLLRPAINSAVAANPEPYAKLRNIPMRPVTIQGRFWVQMTKVRPKNLCYCKVRVSLVTEAGGK